MSEPTTYGELLTPRELKLKQRGDQLKELLRAYVADEDRFSRGEGEPFGSITTETGALARALTR